jgi:hypothetical protein
LSLSTFSIVSIVASVKTAVLVNGVKSSGKRSAVTGIPHVETHPCRCHNFSPPVRTPSRKKPEKILGKTGPFPVKTISMSQPFTWSSNFKWNSPQAVWNGSTNVSNTTKPMTQDLISLGISDADWTAIDGALTTLETKLGDKLLDLSIEQRQSLTKMGDKSEAFCRQALITGRQNAAKLPTDTANDLAAEEADLADLDALRPRLARLNALREKADDTEVALGSDIMVFCLSLYGILKAIGVAAGAGLDLLRAQLSTRFARKTRASKSDTASK